MTSAPAARRRHSDIGKRFAQAALTYDAVAVLQRGIAESLLTQAHRLLPAPAAGEHWVDIGCGTGYLTQRLADQKPACGSLLGIDIALPMLKQARTCRTGNIAWLQADAAQLPLVSARCDRLYSSLALQWLDDMALFLVQAHRCLRPGGWLVFTTLGDDTLQEFRTLQETVEHRRPFSLFMSEQQLLRVIEASPLRLHHHRRQAFCCHYANVQHLMRGLSRLGAQGPEHRAQGLRGKRWLKALDAASASIRTPQGIPARYDTHFLMLQRPAAS